MSTALSVIAVLLSTAALVLSVVVVFTFRSIVEDLMLEELDDDLPTAAAEGSLQMTLFDPDTLAPIDFDADGYTADGTALAGLDDARPPVPTEEVAKVLRMIQQRREAEPLEDGQ